MQYRGMWMKKKEIISDNENVPGCSRIENGEEAVGAANLEDFVINNGVVRWNIMEQHERLQFPRMLRR